MRHDAGDRCTAADSQGASGAEDRDRLGGDVFEIEGVRTMTRY